MILPFTVETQPQQCYTEGRREEGRHVYMYIHVQAERLKLGGRGGTLIKWNTVNYNSMYYSETPHLHNFYYLEHVPLQCYFHKHHALTGSAQSGAFGVVHVPVCIKWVVRTRSTWEVGVFQSGILSWQYIALWRYVHDSCNELLHFLLSICLLRLLIHSITHTSLTVKLYTVTVMTSHMCNLKYNALFFNCLLYIIIALDQCYCYG